MLNPGEKRGSCGSAGSRSLFPRKRNTGIFCSSSFWGWEMDPGVALILQGIQGRKRDIEIQEVTPDPRDTSCWEGRSTATTPPWDGKLRGAIPSSIPGATRSDKSLFWECGRGSTKSRRSWQFRRVGGASLPFTPWES